ncbi:response regulator [Donghicola sp. C2-DW-16]|uniref:histidine kinase n=1 Tax=Donghicola mangrovi TaxID=2729614 RepID=A0ABX2PDB1_9RHOB|nr:histidine kinase N-terminal 7TM domain-containing protein [Donghicola mangrovi]NVO27445.1 response regulator [Donghicola mangrovi]
MHTPQCLTLTAPHMPAYVAMATFAGVAVAGLTVLRKREFHGRPYFLIGFLATQGWLLGVLLELLSSAPECKMWWAEISYLFITLLPTAWCYFLYDYSHARSDAMSLPRLASMIVSPFAIVLLATTNGMHHLFYLDGTKIIEIEHGIALEYLHGPLFYLAAAYLYLFLVASIVIVLRSLIRAQPAFRPYFLTLFLMTLIPSAGNVAYVVFGISFYGFDPTPFLFSMVMILLVRMILTNKVFDIASIAQSYMFLDAEQPVAVIDEDGKFIVTNPSFDILRAETGNDGAVYLADWEELNTLAFDYTQPKGSLLVAEGRSYELRVIPIDKPLRGSQSCMGWMLLLKDVTEVLQSNAELGRALHRAESANRMKSQFIANMSHEIRTPLNGILGMAEVLSHEITSPRHAEMVETIRQSGDVLLNVLNDILDLSKIEAGKLALMPEPFDPQELVRRATGLHRLAAERKDVPLIVEMPSGNGPRREGDPMRLMQILNNLLSNATKFTDKGSITLRMDNPADGNLVFTVIDTGIGMTPEEITRIFEDFEQADGAITRRYGGTGLGMSIIRRLVTMMNGRIDVTSRKGAGTKVEVSVPLPVSDASAEVQQPEPAPAPSTILTGLNVLAADDNGTNRLILGSLLKRAGMRAVLVTNGREAVEKFPDGEWDVILLDISMPEMDGLTALEAIDTITRKTGRKRPPCIAISANVMADQIQEYLGAGFDACVGKPFRSTDVLNTIEAELARRQ